MTSPAPSPGYAARLAARQDKAWKRFVPNPYRIYLRRLQLGRTLEVGCGVGRNLGYLAGSAVGVDSDPEGVALCRARGYIAFLAAQFEALPASFDSLLVSHVLEHVAADERVAFLARYVAFVRSGGRVVVITPQERGYASDTTHVAFADFRTVASLCESLGLRVVTQRSFPLPRAFGRLFVYNEFVTTATVP